MKNNSEIKFKQICKSWFDAGAPVINIADLESVYGLRIESDERTGKVTGATVDNEPVTLTKALVLRAKLSYGRLSVNTKTGEFSYSGLDPVVANCLIDAVKKNFINQN